MAFFEEIGKHITQAGQGVAQQTKNLTDTARLNAAVSEKEKQIQKLYTQIGQAYYERWDGETDALESEKMKQIRTLQAEIDQCKKDMNQIKGVRECPNCHAEIKEGNRFCNYCGAKL